MEGCRIDWWYNRRGNMEETIGTAGGIAGCTSRDHIHNETRAADIQQDMEKYGREWWHSQ
jgi:hypothetical protein